MKKIVLILALALVLVIFAFTNLHAEENSVENYFPMKLNVGYYYNVVQQESAKVDMVGRLFEYWKCVKREIDGGELTGIFKITTYVESMRLDRIEVYAIGRKEVFLSYSKSSYGSHRPTLRPIILKIPQKNMKEKWEWEDERDKGKSKAICTSEYISILKTTLGTFQNVIMATNLTYIGDKLITTDVKYYAKDLGLIREEVGRGKDKVVIDLVKVEDH
jgi:hypothetical protein